MSAQHSVEVALTINDFPDPSTFNSAAFESELASELAGISPTIPASSIFVTEIESGAGTLPLTVAITGLTAVQENEVKVFFDNNPTLVLAGFGDVTTDFSLSIEKPADRVSFVVQNVCVTFDGGFLTPFDYITAFQNVLDASVPSATVSINSISQPGAAVCVDSIPFGESQVQTAIEVDAGDLAAVLALLPTAQGTIDLGAPFGATVSLGDSLVFN